MHRAIIAKGVAACGAICLIGALGCSGKPQPQAPPSSASAAAEAAPAVEPLAPTEAAPEPEASVEATATRELQPGEELNGEALADVPASDPARLLHDSLDAFEASGAFWQQGQIDDAIVALDNAYALMVDVPADGDPMLAQEKENLRGLISRRIVEIYASRRSAVGDPSSSIPRVVNDEVRREITSFQTREREQFLEAYRRSGLYRPYMVAELRKAGLPEQLSWLPMVESWYKDRALSTARALGLWQFIPSTGYRYGLDRDNFVDERMDFEKSTQAAIAYLDALHAIFGDWLTALAAYNCGEGNVLRQINRQSVAYFDQFWDLYERLPRETRRYVPRFLATLEILDDPAKYGFELPQPLPALEYETVEVARPTQLAALEKAMALESGTLVRLNPELRRNATPSKAYPLRVPPGRGATVLASLDSLPKYVPPPAESASTHVVRRGDTLSGIASRYRTSINAIATLNRLRNSHRLSIGQRLLIPGRGGSSSGAGAGAARSSGGVYVVRAGDTLGSIAAREGVSLARLLAV
ncbi:MAG: transglycosylase SLT domain-containing protein, partial [Thermoanaerobaculia bacterium]|nr:transglycosylase SLT domain-containing protein [Thermoanaerobaculia bacterium]